MAKPKTGENQELQPPSMGLTESMTLRNVALAGLINSFTGLVKAVTRLVEVESERRS